MRQCRRLISDMEGRICRPGADLRAFPCMPRVRDDMAIDPRKTRRHSTEAARAASIAVRKAKAAGTVGLPELFIVKAEDPTFTWELRRFGGVVLQRGAESFATVALARSAGEAALAALCATHSLPTTKRQAVSRASTVG